MQARRILREHRIEKLPLVDRENRVAGLITAKDVLRTLQHPQATKDAKGRLRVGAAVGVRAGFLERNRADIVKGIMLGNAEPAYTFVDPKALDFADKTKGIIKEDVERAKKLLDEAGWKVGADGIREKDGVKLAPKVLFTQVAYFPRVSEAIQGYLRKIGVDWKIAGCDFTIAPAKMAKQDYELVDGDGALPLGGRPDEHLLQFEEHPDAQPDELEGRRDRRVAEARPCRADRRRRAPSTTRRVQQKVTRSTCGCPS